MRKRVAIAACLSLALTGFGACWVLRQLQTYFDPFSSMQPGLIQTPGPLPITTARARTDCPIPLPETATNIQYAVWSLWQASQTFARFEAPVSDCLEHAQDILRPFADQGGVSVALTNVMGPLPAPTILAPKDLAIPWFDLSRFSAGVMLTVDDVRAPTVWVDTNRGCFYYAWDQ